MTEDKEILKRINECISTENGSLVTIDSMFTDAQMDSLGSLICLLEIAESFGIDDELVENYDLTKLSIKDLIASCK